MNDHADPEDLDDVDAEDAWQDEDDWDDEDFDDEHDTTGAEDAVMIGGYPACPACRDSLFIPHHSNDRLVFCDRDATLIRLPPALAD